jgi:hypothetical protein
MTGPVPERVPITVYYRRGDRFLCARFDVDAELAAFLEATGACVLAHPMVGWRSMCADLHHLLDCLENRDLPGPADWMDDAGVA